MGACKQVQCKYVPKLALCSSSSLSICVPLFLHARTTTRATSKSYSSVASGIWNALQIIWRPSQLVRLSEKLSNVIYSCFLTLTIVQNLVRSNQLNVSHFVIQCKLLTSHSPEIPCRPSKGVPHERLRLVKRFISYRLHTGAWVNLVLLNNLFTYFFTDLL